MMEAGVEYGHDYGKITLVKDKWTEETVQPSAAAVFLGAHVEWALMRLYGELVFPDIPFRQWNRHKQAKWRAGARKSLKYGAEMKGETGA
jgi:hypothetical protein